MQAVAVLVERGVSVFTQAELRDYLGLDAVDCTFYFGGIPYDKVRRSFELFAREVMPRFADQAVAA